MSAIRPFITLLFALFVFSFAFTQVEGQTTTVQSGLTITASVADERVRITAPAYVVQMHVEVYAATGEKLFDQEIRGGNVFDWHLQNGQAQRLASGAYLCVVTTKSISGRLAQKIGTVIIEDRAASVQPADSQKLSALQAQAIGPVEENSSWTIVGSDESQTPTVIANDGKDGQMIRGRGALTFRIGNFFSGVDKEQMRLTETGDVGVGTSEPKAKLDVAGTIRAERFLVAKPEPADGDKTAANTLATDSADSAQSLVAGSGTQNQITKWTDNAGTMGDSGITETGSNVGIGTTNPGFKLNVRQDDAATAGVINPALVLSNQNYTVNTGVSLGFEFGNGILGAAITGTSAQSSGGGSLLFSTRDNVGAYAERMRITQYGNVGIGTSWPEPRNRLVVRGMSTGFNDTIFRVERAEDGLVALTAGFGKDGITGKPGSNNMFFGTSTNHPLIFTTNDTERIRIDTAGNVGIGTTTPGFPLTVNGVIHSTTGGFRFPDGTTQTTAGALPGTGTLNMLPLWTGPATLGNSMLVQLNNQIGIGTTQPSAKLHVAGGDVLFENRWRTETTTVNSPAVPGPPNLIGGFLGTFSGGAWTGNRVTPGVAGATIGGGGFNGTIIIPLSGTFPGSNSNRVTDWFGTVAGGLNNRAGDDNARVDDAKFATVSGGYSNIAIGGYSTIGGGSLNTAGWNTATVGGGRYNTANGNYPTVGGGVDNTASGTGATVSGGTDNAASGRSATVPGGNRNSALGTTSFAAGNLAKANHHGTFVWADTTGVDFSFAPIMGGSDFASTADNQFLIRASGGVGIGTNSPKAQLQVTSGDVYVETQGKGIILKATDGPGCFRVTVNSAGTLAATSITCP